MGELTNCIMGMTPPAVVEYYAVGGVTVACRMIAEDGYTEGPSLEEIDKTFPGAKIIPHSLPDEEKWLVGNIMMPVVDKELHPKLHGVYPNHIKAVADADYSGCCSMAADTSVAYRAFLGAHANN